MSQFSKSVRAGLSRGQPGQGSGPRSSFKDQASPGSPRNHQFLLLLVVEFHSRGELVVVQSLSRVRFFEIPWIVALQASLSFTVSCSLLKSMSIESVMPSNHLLLCRPLLLLSSIFPSMRVFSKESVLRIRWPKYWSFSFSISPASECSGELS